jgi:hypothetical protein
MKKLQVAGCRLQVNIGLIVVALYALCATLSAPCASAVEVAGIPGAHVTITPGSVPIGFTAATLKPTTGQWAGQTAQGALVQARTNTANFCIDGTTPTQSTGTDDCLQLDALATYVIRGQQAMQRALFVDRVAGSATTIKATVFYGREP